MQSSLVTVQLTLNKIQGTWKLYIIWSWLTLWLKWLFSSPHSFHKYIKHVPISGSLLSIALSILDALLLDIPMAFLLTSFMSLIEYHIIKETFPNSLSKTGFLPVNLSLYTTFFLILSTMGHNIWFSVCMYRFIHTYTLSPSLYIYINL